MTLPALAFKPEPLLALQARLPEALAPIWDFRDSQPESGPGQRREHVFDFQDGLRLIVSRDKQDEGKPYLHVSASITPSHALYDKVENGFLTRYAIKTIVEERFFRLSGQSIMGMDVLLLWSEGKGVPHWFKREK